MVPDADSTSSTTKHYRPVSGLLLQNFLARLFLRVHGQVVGVQDGDLFAQLAGGGLLPFQEEDARSAGRVRAALEAAGKPIGAYDVLIAGQALRHRVTLVTANAKEFARVKGLVWVDWAKR